MLKGIGNPVKCLAQDHAPVNYFALNETKLKYTVLSGRAGSRPIEPPPQKSS